MYKINMNIPGWNGKEILNIIAQYASNVSATGHILELGALFGRTTYALGYNKPKTTTLTTIDIWPDLLYEQHTNTWFHDKRCGAEETKLVESFFKDNPARIPGESFHELWKIFTSGIPSLSGMRSLTNLDNTNFPMFDLIIHDASHDFDGVYEDLVRWFPKLKPYGVMIIDDYEPQFPGLVKAVDKYALENSLIREMITGRNVILRRKQ